MMIGKCRWVFVGMFLAVSALADQSVPLAATYELSGDTLVIRDGEETERLTLDTGIEADEMGDFQTAYRIFAAFAERGHPEATYRLARMHKFGQGTRRDSKRAFSLFLKAAEAGHLPSQDEVAFFYLTGTGTTRDPEKGFQWVKRAADAGYAPAQSHVASFYADGNGTEKDIAAAIRYYRMAAEQSDASAMNTLAAMMEKGRDLPKDLSEARRLYAGAAAQRYIPALANLARIDGDEQGTRYWWAKYEIGGKRHAEALDELGKLADGGYALAQKDFGYMLMFGQGVAPDPERARLLLQDAVRQGEAEALVSLGMGHVLELVGGADKALGLAYMRYAEKVGDSDTKKIVEMMLKKFGSRLTAEETRRAEDLSSALPVKLGVAE